MQGSEEFSDLGAMIKQMQPLKQSVYVRRPSLISASSHA